MVTDSKDRYGEKMHDLERARENQYAAERDRELLEKIRQKAPQAHKATSEAPQPRESMLCPRCHRVLVAQSEAGVTLMACPIGDGAWVDRAILEQFLKHPTPRTPGAP